MNDPFQQQEQLINASLDKNNEFVAMESGLMQGKPHKRPDNLKEYRWMFKNFEDIFAFVDYIRKNEK